MKLKRKELSILIEGILKEEDMFSAARKAMGSASGDASGQKSGGSIGGKETEQLLAKTVKEELQLTKQFFNEVVRPALGKDPNNLNIKVDSDYIIFDSGDMENVDSLVDDPTIKEALRKMNAVFAKLFSGDNRYFVCFKEGQTIKTIDDRITLSYKTANELIGEENKGFISATLDVGRKMIPDSLTRMYTFEQVYKMFMATAKAAGI
jgi:hypothetical protein